MGNFLAKHAFLGPAGICAILEIAFVLSTWKCLIREENMSPPSCVEKKKKQ
jgi:hypothetical protein